MHSGGGTKEAPYEIIYIEADEEQAKVIFYNRFKHNPERVTCTCCGGDYSISSEESLEQLTAFHRELKYNRETRLYFETDSSTSMEDYKARKDTLFISKDEILDSERIGRAPKQGYIWVDNDE